MTRNTKLVLLSLGLVATTAGGYVAGRGIKSPADAAAQTAAPPASLITTTASEQVLSSDLIVRGTVRFGDPRDVQLAPSEVSADSGIVVSTSASDTMIDSGAVAAVISGRPVFALSGVTPVYRDLGIGVVGDDVAQLEAALVDFGYDPGALDSRYDAATAVAVGSWYTAEGFAPAGDALTPAVPADEIVFFPTLPVRVDEVLTGVGDPLDGPLFSVTDATIGVDVALSIADAQILAEGLPAIVEETDLGIRLDSTVTALAGSPGTNGVEPNQVYMEVTPTDAPAGLVGTSVKITIPIESTSGAVLTVPASALSISADGSTNVQVQDAAGTTRIVDVTTGLAANGFVEIVSGDVAAGDLVVIGVEST